MNLALVPAKSATGPSSTCELGPTLATRLRELLRGQSVNAFAKKCGVPESSMRLYMAGTQPRPATLMKIANANGVTTDWLAGRKGPAPDFGKSSVERALDSYLTATSLESFIEVLEDAQSKTGKRLSPRQKARLISVASQIASRLSDEDQRTWMTQLTVALIDMMLAD